MKLLIECTEWHERGEWGIEELAPTRPLARVPVDGVSVWQCGRNTIRQLLTVSALIEESRAMRHCIASHANMAVSGEVAIFHAELAGQAVTIEIAWRSAIDDPVLVEVARVGNARVGLDDYGVIREWLHDLQAVRDAASTGVEPVLRGRFLAG